MGKRCPASLGPLPSLGRAPSAACLRLATEWGSQPSKRDDGSESSRRGSHLLVRFQQILAR